MSIYKALNIALIPGDTERATLEMYAGSLSTPYWHWHIDAILHLTLWMGIVKSDDIPSLADLIQPEIHSITAKTGGYSVITIPGSNRNVVSLNLERSEELLVLHTKIALLAKRFQRRSEDAVFFGEEIGESTISYLNAFSEKHTHSNYLPHITLGIAETTLQPQNPPIISEITFKKAGIFWMSNACTCVQPEVEFSF